MRCFQLKKVKNILNKLDLKKIYLILISFLMVFIPFRNLLALYLGDFIKLIPDIISIGLFFVFFFFDKKTKKNIIPIDIVFAIFILFGFISTILINNLEIMRFVYQFRSLVVLYPVFFVFRNYKFSKKEIDWLIIALQIVGCILFSHMLIEKIFNKTILFPEFWRSGISNSNYFRVYSLMNNPNNFGAYIVSVAYLILLNSKRKISVFRIISLFMIFFGVVLSASRSSIALLLFLILGMAAYDLKTKKFILKRFVKIIALLLLAWFMAFQLDISTEKYYSYKSNAEISNVSTTDCPEKTTNEIVQRIFDENLLEKSLSYGRIYRVKKGLEIFKDHRLVGSGFGTFGSSSAKIMGSSLADTYDFNPKLYSDNEYIAIVAETGIVGTIIFIAFIFSLLIYSWKSKMLFLYLLGFLALGMFYNVFEVQTITIIFWFLLSQRDNYFLKDILTNKKAKKSKVGKNK